MYSEPFIIDDNQDILYLRGWNDIDNKVMAGFTTRIGGVSHTPFDTFNLGLHVKDNITDVITNRETLAKRLRFPLSQWVCAEQIHDKKVVKVTKKHVGLGVYNYEQGITGTDGIYTDNSNILLTLCFADCVPIYFFDPVKRLIGLAHAGWQGSVKNIASEIIQKWVINENVDPTNIKVVIGPSISECCYIVDDKVIEAAREALNNTTTDHYYTEVSKGQYRLDLKTLNKLLLIENGVSPSNIEVSSYCTSCESKFFSHRRDKGKTGRMLSFIGLKED